MKKAIKIFGIGAVVLMMTLALTSAFAPSEVYSISTVKSLPKKLLVTEDGMSCMEGYHYDSEVGDCVPDEPDDDDDEEEDDDKGGHDWLFWFEFMGAPMKGGGIDGGFIGGAGAYEREKQRREQ